MYSIPQYILAMNHKKVVILLINMIFREKSNNKNRIGNLYHIIHIHRYNRKIIKYLIQFFTTRENKMTRILLLMKK